MKKYLRKPFMIAVAVVIAFFFLSATKSFAATITSTAAGGNWNAGGTWIGGAVPAAGDNVIIATTGANSVEINVAITQTGSVTINSGATLSANTTGADATFGSLIINAGGTLIMNRSLTVTGATQISGTVTFASTSAGTRTMTFGGDVTLNSGASWTQVGTGNGSGNSYTFNGNLTNNATTFSDGATGQHTFSGVSKTISGSTTTSMLNVTISAAQTNSGTFVVPTSLTIAGTTLTNNGTVTATTALAGTGGLTNGGTGTLNIGGTITLTTLTATASGNTVNYTAGGNQTLKTTAYYNLGLSGSGNKTFGATITMANNLSISGAAIASLGNNNFSVPTLNLNGVGQLAGTYGSSASAATNKIAASFGAAGTGILTVTVGSCISPTAFSVTGGGGYCAGGSGVAIGLSNSENGVTYQLFIGGTTPVGSPVSGTTAAITFGNQIAVGTYTVKATRTLGGCTNNMTGSASVSINPLPTTSFTKNDVKCFGTSTGKIVITGVGGTGPYTYSIDNGTNYSSPVPTGTFDNLPLGTYKIRVKDANQCESKPVL